MMGRAPARSPREAAALPPSPRSRTAPLRPVRPLGSDAAPSPPAARSPVRERTCLADCTGATMVTESHLPFDEGCTTGGGGGIMRVVVGGVAAHERRGAHRAESRWSGHREGVIEGAVGVVCEGANGRRRRASSLGAARDSASSSSANSLTRLASVSSRLARARPAALRSRIEGRDLFLFSQVAISTTKAFEPPRHPPPTTPPPPRRQRRRPPPPPAPLPREPWLSDGPLRSRRPRPWTRT